jgi:hypothetical protein
MPFLATILGLRCCTNNYHNLQFDQVHNPVVKIQCKNENLGSQFIIQSVGMTSTFVDAGWLVHARDWPIYSSRRSVGHW